MLFQIFFEGSKIHTTNSCHLGIFFSVPKHLRSSPILVWFLLPSLIISTLCFSNVTPNLDSAFKLMHMSYWVLHFHDELARETTIECTYIKLVLTKHMNIPVPSRTCLLTAVQCRMSALISRRSRVFMNCAVCLTVQYFIYSSCDFIIFTIFFKTCTFFVFQNLSMKRH